MSDRLCALAGMALLLLPGCASEPMKAPPALPQPSVSALGEVPTQQLTKGQCALVLWSRKMPATRFLVTLNEPAVARVAVDGRVMEAVRIAQSGRPIYGQFPEQRYRSEGLSLTVSFAADEAKSLTGGAVLPSAAVEYTDSKGWTTVVPAAGMIACLT